MDAGALEVSIPHVALPAEVQAQIKKSSGKLGLETVKAQMAAAYDRTHLKAVVNKASDTIAKSYTNVKNAVREVPANALTTVGAAAVGAYAGYRAYEALSTYFADPAKPTEVSWAPDAIVLIGGAAVAYIGAQLKDAKDQPGSAAGARSALIGLGGGMIVAGGYEAYVHHYSAA